MAVMIFTQMGALRAAQDFAQVFEFVVAMRRVKGSRYRTGPTLLDIARPEIPPRTLTLYSRSVKLEGFCTGRDPL